MVSLTPSLAPSPTGMRQEARQAADNPMADDDYLCVTTGKQARATVRKVRFIPLGGSAGRC